MSPICEQQRIAGGRCTNRALYVATWQGAPGSIAAARESAVCGTCVHKMRNTAASLGLGLDLRSCDEDKRDTQPAPPLNEDDNDPPWMRDTQPGTDSVGDSAPKSLRDYVHRPWVCVDCGGVGGLHSLLCTTGRGKP